MKKIFLIALAFVAALNLSATVPYRLVLPDAGQYKILCGDLHIHTVFSDANVWPVYRVYEAWYEGLDFISMTDHTDLVLQKNALMAKGKYFDSDRDESYRLAQAEADKKGVLLIHGGEMSRSWCPPGHFNMHFVSSCEEIMQAVGPELDGLKRKKEDHVPSTLIALREARKQGAFITWNHPHWEAQCDSMSVWDDVHTQMLEEGLFDGIEIWNGGDGRRGYDPVSHHWCIEKNLAIVSGTDCHSPIRQEVNVAAGDRRPLTLVFARERSLEGVREALDSRLSCVFADNKVYGSEKTCSMLLDAILDMKVTAIDGKAMSVRIENKSSIPVVLRRLPHGNGLRIIPWVTIKPFTSYTIKASQITDTPVKIAPGVYDFTYEVENFFVDAGTPAKLHFHYEQQ